MTNGEHEKATVDVTRDVFVEMGKQVAKWGNQEHTYQKWRTILNEELAEMETEVIVCETDGYSEGVQVAAVMMSWLRNIQVQAKRRDEIARIWKGILHFEAGEDLKAGDNVYVNDAKVYKFTGLRAFDYYAKNDAKEGGRIGTMVKSFKDIMEGK